MSLLQAFLTKFSSRTNVDPKIVMAVADDGSAAAIDAGKPSPLRADPTTGALIVSSAAGASLGAVAQGAGASASPWYTQPKLSSTGPVPKTAKTVPTAGAEAIVSVSTPVTKFVRVTSDFANTKTVYVSGTGVTVANGQPLGPGDVYTCTDVDNANLIFCISADAAQVLRIEVL